jgi:hypothetical protein
MTIKLLITAIASAYRSTFVRLPQRDLQTALQSRTVCGAFPSPPAAGCRIQSMRNKKAILKLVLQSCGFDGSEMAAVLPAIFTNQKYKRNSDRFLRQWSGFIPGVSDVILAKARKNRR